MSVKLYFYCRLEELLQLVLDVCNVLDLNKLVYTICTTILDITHASRYLYLDNRHVAKYVTWSFLRFCLFWRLCCTLCASAVKRSIGYTTGFHNHGEDPY